MCRNTERSEGGRRTSKRSALYLLLGGLLFATCQGIAHLAAVSAHPRWLGLVPLFIPAALTLAVSFRRSLARGAAALAGIALLLAASLRWTLVAAALPLLPQLVISLGVMWLFARSLLPGRRPLITRMAAQVHGALPAEIASYTRKLTWAWALWMVVLAAVSVALYAFAPRPIWSMFANLLFFPLVALMFVGEFAYRRVRYSWFKAGSFRQSILAFRRHAGAGSASSRW